MNADKLVSNMASESSSNNISGRQKRKERNRSIRQIGSHHKTDNSLAIDIPRVTGPIDADRYALARILEINDMQAAIKKASYALNELAFQSLPRGLRRRAASHNINRLPARLRAKAAKEAYSSAPNSKLIRKKIKKIKTPKNTVEEFLRRQKSKKWLETHIWHTKRMKMNDIWGYRIASRPNTKSVRTIYRSFTRLSIIHDASYMACIELSGVKEEIVKVMNTMTDLGLPSVGSERYIKGNRCGTTHLYEYLGYPTKLICPISFLWKFNSQDTIWLWIHPSAITEALVFLKKAIKEQKATSIQLRDLRDEVLRFELTGPRSTALLQAILDPIQDGTINGNQIWKNLHQLRSSCSLSPGTVIGLIVNDPRLRFPQKVPPRTNEITLDEQKEVQKLIENWPADAAETCIWDEDLRKSLLEKKIPEYGLNLRRQNNLIPGTKLQPTSEDSKIPVLLIQRGSPSNDKAGFSQKPLSSQELVEGWTIIIPKGFGLPFWKSFVFAGARVAGYDDVRSMHFESGYPCFPQDYPGTRAFEGHRCLFKEKLEAVWQKKPPAKRVNFKKRGVDHPFECAFETLSTTEHMQLDVENNLPTRPTYSILQGPALIIPLLSSGNFLDELTKLQKKRGIRITEQDISLADTLVKVRLKYIDRGKPVMNSMIYSLEDINLYDQYTVALRQKLPKTHSKRKAEVFSDGIVDKYKATYLPDKAEQIGYVTNGDFSLTLGHGFGLGACTIAGLQRLQKIDTLQKRTLKMIVLVRNPSSLKARPAQLEILY
ncbi:ribonucleases P/MRP protein subunit POP1-domain-containing protein [Mycotypha africana]|uniref:ribonucleases P/MRP protein subunit POP1-domain-containing protein n=1 Tax=Mycotypha africana TaxID=64632 RepID=UPI0023008449|nr:ribonucleases P/MRP protein subunit POP1-domain-containing protein [Mycotypha africana]KAI8970247.1 ribonucleases P/MRP protein subunit POP1-domain-containing protein [Mycotypha africana]